MSDNTKTKQITELLLASIDGTITHQQFNQLEQLLNQDPISRQSYYDLVEIIISLNQSEGLLALQQTTQPTDQTAPWLESLALHEKKAPQVICPQPEKPAPQPQPIESHIPPQPKRPISKLSAWTLVLAALITICLISFELIFPVPDPVATLTGSVNATWDTSTAPMVLNDKIRPGKLQLLSGYAELTFTPGSTIILEAPATVNLQNDHTVRLLTGKLTATVPHTASGFTVQTSNATIVDYGTEFGVEIDKAGTVATHVFTGKVNVQTTTNKTSSWLTENQAISVDHKGTFSTVYPSENRTFVRSLQTVEDWQNDLNRNLIINPGFEADTPGTYNSNADLAQQITNINITGWTDTGLATIYTYNGPAQEEFPQPNRHILPTNHGNNFFIGVDNGQIHQDIDVHQLANLIDRQALTANISGWLGGFKDHADQIQITASFMDKNNRTLSQLTLGPITSAQRNNQTGFIQLQNHTLVPAGTDHIRITLQCQREQGIADAYADELELRLTTTPDILQ